MYSSIIDYHSPLAREYTESVRMDYEDGICCVDSASTASESEDSDNQLNTYDELEIQPEKTIPSCYSTPPTLVEDKEQNYPIIPFVMIAYNNLTFVRNYVNQLRRFPHRIIIFDNASSYPAMHTYYDELEKELGSKLTIHRFNENGGHNVYQSKLDLLPTHFILSDPDLQLHPDMPLNVDEIFLQLSKQYKVHKVGAALDLSDKEEFIECPNYGNRQTIADFESQYWNHRLSSEPYEIYSGSVDTTFCLVNTEIHPGSGIRVAGNFTAKHLPWYKDYIKNNVPQEEIDHWTRNNKSSSILTTCLKL